MNNDPLANALSKIYNAEKVNKKEVVLCPVSNLIIKVLEIFEEKGYIESYEVKEKDKKRYVVVKLANKINKCGAIKPRFYVKKNEYEKFEKRYLPAAKFGYLIVSTNEGLMTNEEAKERKKGGTLIAFVY